MNLLRAHLDPSLIFYPAGLLAMAAEGLVAWRKGRVVYRAADTVCNLGTALLDQWLVTLAARLVALELYSAVWMRCALFSIDALAVSTWIFAFLAYDFVYYWRHRLFHECNLLWASHVVHHQSEEFNLSVGLRVSWSSRAFALLLNLPLALLGIPPLPFVAASVAHNVYQFCLHTRLVRPLGPIEALMVTPSHHRVHHGTDRSYVNRNYGGFFIFWDKLFGTFARETTEPIYGVQSPPGSCNPVIHYVQPWRSLAMVVRRSRSAREAIAYLLRPRFVADTAAAPSQSPPERGARAIPTLRRRDAVVAGLQFTVLCGLSSVLLSRRELSSAAATFVLVCASVWGLFVIGRLVDRRARSVFAVGPGVSALDGNSAHAAGPGQSAPPVPSFPR
jgi:sterol desaturase/sphingolipid hydroxylase (fatty acid hydroxylase superfamily)